MERKLPHGDATHPPFGAGTHFAARNSRLAGCAILLCVALVAITLDAGERRRAALPALAISRAAVRTLGTPDLALSSSSRWLRHPSQAEPGAPFSDSPAALDPDPGGSVLAPPRELLGVGARDLVIRPRRRER